jgi:small conductance mechanosensitive channel
MALGILHLDKTVTSLLAGAGVIGLALSFAFQDIAANFMSGILIAVRRPFKVGDNIETNSYAGTITKINLRTTTLDSFQGQKIMIPNKDVFQGPLTNFSTGQRRIDLEVGVSYNDDLIKVREVAEEVVKSIARGFRDEDTKVFFKGFGGSSIDLVVQYWIDLTGQRDYLDARSEGIIKIKKAFDENGISIPFPIRTLDIPREFTEAMRQKNYSGNQKEIAKTNINDHQQN